MELYDDLQKHTPKISSKEIPMYDLSIQDTIKRLEEQKKDKEKNRSYEANSKHYLDVVNIKYADDELVGFLARLENNISSDLNLHEIIEKITQSCYSNNKVIEEVVTETYPFYSDLLKLELIIDEEKVRFYEVIESFESKHEDLVYTQVITPKAIIERKLNDDGEMDIYYKVDMKDTAYYDIQLEYVFFTYWLDKPISKDIELLSDNIVYTLADYQLQAMYRSETYEEKVVNIKGSYEALSEDVFDELRRYDGPSKNYE